MNHYNVKVDAFEGPLDLLLHLINKYEVDIYDIPVSQITDQYLTYIHTMQELELDIASEYLVMAATLLAIKSKTLLPQREEELFEEEHDLEDDPREELVQRLVEYRKYKEAADELKKKESSRSLLYTRPPADVTEYTSEDSNTSIGDVTLYDMLAAFQKMSRRVKEKKPKRTTIKTEEIPIEDRMNEIKQQLRGGGRKRFTDLFTEHEKGPMIVTFLAILELMKTRELSCEQEGNFGEIMIFESERKAME
ncbi:segregation/condensation protein A [Guptibacillus algicola]|uniref:segregation/condensation protein A n=1 Tax=Guptibacillus algicola TaxID=225844 RepID=UPI001CD73D56|nr:segregation/condensation protein A [Alkalihalobacillus algicola]MCA0985843.1 segregation/condensation protein A [Alkalihalobacillus algicola]